MTPGGDRDQLRLPGFGSQIGHDRDEVAGIIRQPVRTRAGIAVPVPAPVGCHDGAGAREHLHQPGPGPAVDETTVHQHCPRAISLAPAGDPGAVGHHAHHGRIMVRLPGRFHLPALLMARMTTTTTVSIHRHAQAHPIDPVIHREG
jgi:hypothetical protein